MTKTPLFDAIAGYAARNPVRFHTPGYAGRFNPLSAAGDIGRFDVTELPGLQSLFEDKGAIFEAEKLAAALFGAQKTCFSAGGNTLCIQTMLASVRLRGREIICARNVHRSVVNAFALLEFDPVWIYGDGSAGSGLFGRITGESVREQLRRQKQTAAVFVTSPDYYGVMSDIKGISEACGEYGVPLLVDNAHGSHLIAFDGLHPIRSGAAMSADSAHKTLPVLTGGAWLHINRREFAEQAKRHMAIFGSTSPSYPIMASLDLCREWLDTEGKEAFSRLSGRVGEMRELCRRGGIPVIEGGLTDPVRLTMRVSSVGISGQRAYEHFWQNGISAEYGDGDYLVLIPTAFHTPEDFERLERQISSLLSCQGGANNNSDTESALKTPPKRADMSIREAAVLSGTSRIDVTQAVGRVAAETACQCPPGVPIVVPGEIIDENIKSLALKAGIFTIDVVE